MNQQAGARQTGFTLVEVLIVVVIISLLIGLATPAIVIALRKTEVATMRIELSLVEQALEAYKNEYGEYPPDFTDNQYVIDHLNRLFPRRRELRYITELEAFFSNGTLPGPSGNGGLFPDQALLFWLRGFHPSPEYPITGDTTGNADPINGAIHTERESLVEFNEKMIGTVIGGWGEDSNLETPGELLVLTRAPSAPIVYFDSRQGYLVGGTCKRFSGRGLGTAAPYISDRTQQFANPKKFQLISAGPDGHYGNFNSNPEPGVNLKSYPSGTNYDSHSSGVNYDLVEGDTDNLTNFSSGTLGEDKDSQP